jgi:predicted ATPase/class 3 adenylate cyclase/predicted negative regulator of RcsB-dependent stress response
MLGGVRALPMGTVTFLFTDIEGSTRLLQELGDGYAEALIEHKRVLRSTFAAHGGVEVDTQGDAFFVAFPRAKDALAAAGEARDALADGPIRVRMGVHTGEPLVSEEGYVGIDVHRAARIAAAGHGGQVLVSQSTNDLVGGRGMRDLGEHRLKDLTAPERIYQLGDGSFQPLNSLHQTNLPVQPTPLIGRERELQDVLDLIASARLLTLSGAGGSGKTRLALQAAAEVVDDFVDGVWFISLADMTDPELVVPTIASVIGAKDDLIGSLGARRLLLVVDNVEQLLPAAAATIAGLLTAPNVQVLATSRARLAVAAEQEYAVPTLTHDDAIALFVARARQLTPAFVPDEHVGEIARRLDGLPLALELAAARVKVLSLSQLLDRLSRSLDLLTGGARDAPERQHTLRATMEWSFDLLNAEERQLVASLGVFAGSFDLQAAETVCGADLGTLASVIDKSLLRQTDDDRFFMLAIVREFALERLTSTGDAAALRRAHFEYYLEVAKEAWPHLGDADQAVWLDMLEREQNNFRDALSWSLAADPNAALELATWLSRFWRNRDHELEGYRWTMQALANAETAVPDRRARGLLAAGSLAGTVGKTAEAIELLERSALLHQDLGNERLAAHARFTLAIEVLEAGDPARAREMLERAALTFSDPEDSGRAVLMLGEAERALGDTQLAVRHFDEAAAVAAQIGDRHLEAAATHAAGDMHLAHRRVDEAVACYRRSLGLLRGLESMRMVGASLGGLAAVAAVQGNLKRAGALWGAFEAFETALEYPIAPSSRRLYESKLKACRGEEFEHARERGRGLTVEAAVEVAVET